MKRFVFFLMFCIAYCVDAQVVETYPTNDRFWYPPITGQVSCESFPAPVFLGHSLTESECPDMHRMYFMHRYTLSDDEMQTIHGVAIPLNLYGLLSDNDGNVNFVYQPYQDPPETGFSFPNFQQLVHYNSSVKKD